MENNNIKIRIKQIEYDLNRARNIVDHHEHEMKTYKKEKKYYKERIKKLNEELKQLKGENDAS